MCISTMITAKVIERRHGIKGDPQIWINDYRKRMKKMKERKRILKRRLRKSNIRNSDKSNVCFKRDIFCRYSLYFRRLFTYLLILNPTQGGCIKKGRNISYRKGNKGNGKKKSRKSRKRARKSRNRKVASRTTRFGPITDSGGKRWKQKLMTDYFRYERWWR